MSARIDEIADGIYRIAEHVNPANFTFCQFLILAEQPMLFHLGHRKMFADIAEAVSRVIPVESLRWLSFSHVEADECGAMEQWLAAAPQAEVAHSAVGCRIWVNDITDRVRVWRDDEVLDLGGKRIRHLDTSHLPHGWDAALGFEETTETLFCSDLFAHGGDEPALVREDPFAFVAEPSSGPEAMSLTPTAPGMLRRLAGLAPKRLALMHGGTYEGDGAASLAAMAAQVEGRLRAG